MKHSTPISKKARKHGFGPSNKHKSSSVSKNDGLGLSLPFEDAAGFTVIDSPAATFGAPLTRQPSSTSVLTFHSAQSGPSIQTIDSADDSLAPPSISHTSSADSTMSLPLRTPESGSVDSLPSLLQADAGSALSTTSAAPISAHRGSWTSNFGKMAKAVVHTGKSMGIQFGERKKRESGSGSPAPAPTARLSPPAQLPQSPPVATVDCPLPSLVAIPRPSAEELAQLDPQAALARKREWAEAENKRVLECARLCSQWPQSGYNQSKWGPNGQSRVHKRANDNSTHTGPGARAFYEPQSYANPTWVAAVMKRQADLEHQLKSSAATYFTCRRDRQSSSSDDESDQSSESYTSSQSSPTTSSQFEIEQRTIADLKAAMDTTIVDNPAPALRGTRSITELDALASSMALSSSSKDANAMDVDIDSIESVAGTRTRHERAQSCGSKRPLNLVDTEEEKRRKVDEAMVVEEAVSSGVIMPSSPMVDQTGQNRKLSSSTPELSSVKQQQNVTGPAMFGHVVKTSDTHPIIISPFFPTELLSTLASHLVRPVGQTSPMMLGSHVDVPSILLALAPSPSNSVPASPVRPDLRVDVGAKRIGNLLLSSCPGKRLRMEGPVKGRAPVCRDLETDLRRIKNEGVGCLVCCLDDAELALLGVPWETYRAIASKIGLDVIR